MPAQGKTAAARPITSANLMMLALRNMRRHGVRAAVNVVGIAISVAALLFFLSFYRGSYQGAMFSSVIDYATSQGQLMSASFDDDDPDTWLDEDCLLAEELARDGALLEAAAQRDGGWTPTAAPRLMTPAFVGSGSRKASVFLSGVDFAAEAKVLGVQGRVVEGQVGEGVVIGKKLAETLGLSVGDEIRIQANMVDGISNLDYWRVSAIFSTAYPPMDRGLVMMALPEAQDFLGAPGKVNKVYCRLAEGKDSVARDRAIGAMESVAPRLATSGLVFRSWKSYARAIVEDARMDGAFFAIFIGILLFLSLATIAGTMRVTVFERKREIGMLRATGWYRNEIARVFLFEAVIIGIVGGALGCAIGGAASFALEAHPFAFADTMKNLDIPAFALTCDVQPVDFVISLVAGFLTAMFAGISPALTGAKMPILSAMSER